MKKSGALTGLQRVVKCLSTTVTLFVTPRTNQEEFQKILQLIIDVYEDFNLNEYRFRLSYRDPQRYYTNTLTTMKCGKMPKPC